jgi:hypothetical protein
MTQPIYEGGFFPSIVMGTEKLSESVTPEKIKRLVID